MVYFVRDGHLKYCWWGWTFSSIRCFLTHMPWLFEAPLQHRRGQPGRDNSIAPVTRGDFVGWKRVLEKWREYVALIFAICFAIAKTLVGSVGGSTWKLGTGYYTRTILGYTVLHQLYWFRWFPAFYVLWIGAPRKLEVYIFCNREKLSFQQCRQF